MLIERASFTRLCRARDLLCEFPDEPRSIDDVARAVAISPFHFIRQFDALFGQTPHQFRIHYRVDEAKRLLVAGHHSVTAVCMALGFSSLGSFSESFKRRVGSSPSAYQRRWRVVGQVPGRIGGEPIAGCLSLMGRLPSTAFRNFREA